MAKSKYSKYTTETLCEMVLEQGIELKMIEDPRAMRTWLIRKLKGAGVLN